MTETPFGTGPAWSNSDNPFDKAFDGDTGTYFDYAKARGGYTGIDLGEGNESGMCNVAELNSMEKRQPGKQ